MHLDGNFVVHEKELWCAILGGDKKWKKQIVLHTTDVGVHLTWQSSCMANVALANPNNRVFKIDNR